MKIRICYTKGGFYIPQRKFLCFWVDITDYIFSNHSQCLRWVRNVYVPKKKKSRTANYYPVSEIYVFNPEYRSEFDRTFN